VRLQRRSGGRPAAAVQAERLPPQIAAAGTGGAGAQSARRLHYELALDLDKTAGGEAGGSA